MYLVLLIAGAIAQTPSEAATQPVANPTAVKRNKPDKNAVPFNQLLDEMLVEVAHELSALATEDISPIAIGSVNITPTLAHELEETLAIRLTSILADIPGLKQVHCAECFSVRSQMEGGDWVMRRGITGRADMLRVATEIHAKSFLAVGLEYYADESEYLALNVRVLSAKTSEVLYARRILSSETAVALEREGKKVQTQAERRALLEDTLVGKPGLGHEIMLAWHVNSAAGHAALIGYRLFESFGPKRMLQYGFDLRTFFGPGSPFGAHIMGVFNVVTRPANQRVPKFRFGVAGGVLIMVPNATFDSGLLIEMITHLGLGFSARVDFAVPTGPQVGAVSFSLGGVWAWE